jgi:hypothetical protein
MLENHSCAFLPFVSFFDHTRIIQFHSIVGFLPLHDTFVQRSAPSSHSKPMRCLEYMRVSHFDYRRIIKVSIWFLPHKGRKSRARAPHGAFGGIKFIRSRTSAPWVSCILDYGGQFGNISVGLFDVNQTGAKPQSVITQRMLPAAAPHRTPAW